MFTKNEYKQNFVTFIGDEEPQERVQVGNVWYNTKLNTTCVYTTDNVWVCDMPVVYEPSNWFGDGTLGDVWVSTSGGRQSFDGGATYTPISGWVLSGTTVLIPSTQDGDMVVLNCKSLRVDAGMTLTTQYRCRGLLIYTQRDCLINGTISMTARGCKANPDDVTVTAYTPVPPTDNNPVPSTGITIRRLAKDYTQTNDAINLMFGCGLAAVNSEKKQPTLSENGIVINIPKVGGAGAAGVLNHGYALKAGSTPNGTGGGGGGQAYHSDEYGGSYYSGSGSAGTCFSGGSGGGAAEYRQGYNAQPYGGAGGDSTRAINRCPGACGGVGNSSGLSIGSGPQSESGTGGLLILLVGGNLTIGSTGSVLSKGTNSASLFGQHPSYVLGYMAGGGSGGGVISIMYADTLINAGVISAKGGMPLRDPAYDYLQNEEGGDGAVIGPFKIDP